MTQTIKIKFDANQKVYYPDLIQIYEGAVVDMRFLIPDEPDAKGYILYKVRIKGAEYEYAEHEIFSDYEEALVALDTMIINAHESDWEKFKELKKEIKND